MVEERLVLSDEAQRHVDAYIEYVRVVGDTDGGTLLTEDEYEEAKRRAREAAKNRLYVSIRNSQDVECRVVGPANLCFCAHRYRDHATDQTSTKKVRCRVPQCACRCFAFVPAKGSQQYRCSACKHPHSDHNPNKHRHCSRCKCHAFRSSMACVCGEPFESHRTVYETRDERLASGRRVRNIGLPGSGDEYRALGAVTGFASLFGDNNNNDDDGGGGGGGGEEKFASAPVPRSRKMGEGEEMAALEQAFKQTQLHNKNRHAKRQPSGQASKPSQRPQHRTVREGAEAREQAKSALRLLKRRSKKKKKEREEWE